MAGDEEMPEGEATKPITGSENADPNMTASDPVAQFKSRIPAFKDRADGSKRKRQKA